MKIDAEILESPVNGVNLVPGSLGDQLSSDRTLIIFLRFFGCLFCRETVADLRALSEKHESYPSVLFVSEAGATEVRAFVRRYWPDARVVADPETVLYSAFGVGRSVIKSLSPGVFAARRRAIAKGNESGPIDGDAFRMPGAFLIEDRQIVWNHEYKHSADHPEFERFTMPGAP